MDLGFRNLDHLCDALNQSNTFNENLESAIKSLSKDIDFDCLGIFERIRTENIFQVKFHKNLSKDFIQNRQYTHEHELIRRLTDLKSLQGKEFYQTDVNVSDCLIMPFSFNMDLIGFIFFEKKQGLFDASEISKIKIYVSIMNLLIEKEILHKHIDKLVETDSVTGLMNHKSFISNAVKQHAHMKRYKREYSLAIMKINKFDEITEKLGNQRIPIYLREISSIILKNIRDTDFAGVLYPDTFAIFFSEINKDVSKMVCERINNSLIRSPRLTGMQFKWGINDNHSDDDFTTNFKNTEIALNAPIVSVKSHIVIHK